MAPAALTEEQKQAERQYAGWWRYTSRTLRLPAPVLTKFFSGNARRLLHLSAGSRSHPERSEGSGRWCE